MPCLGYGASTSDHPAQASRHQLPTQAPVQLTALTAASDSDDSLLAIFLSWPPGFGRQARFRPQLAHRRSQSRTTCYHGATWARWSAIRMPIVKPSWRRTLHRISRSSTKLRSAEPGSLPTGVPRPDDPIIATSRWGQARSSATPLLSDGDIMGFKSPGQSTHKPP
jgi:hypothetical protein